MIQKKHLKNFVTRGRSLSLEKSKSTDDELGYFETTQEHGRIFPIPGRGWNMIAYRLLIEGGNLNYRLLVNQYDEELHFTTIGKGIPNRGITRKRKLCNSDQFIVLIIRNRSIKLPQTTFLKVVWQERKVWQFITNLDCFYKWRMNSNQD